MPKKTILTFLILIFSLFSLDFTFAYSIPVENVFSDIDSDYKYINELQTLYDKGMIYPDIDGKFNPRDLLRRDEFVGILGEVTCEKCIQPNTALDLINKYENETTFFDINKTNKYFYCIASAAADNHVTGYHPGTTCDDGIVMEGEKPFCAANIIILEEAIAIILRTSGILTYEQAEQMKIDIFNGKITEGISDDVSPLNLDGSVYSFFPDLKKALEYEIVEVDTDGNVKTFTLVEKIDGKIRPKQAISKEMFLKIAYITLKANSCEEKIDNNIALEMVIYDKECSINNSNCDTSDLKDTTNIYDFTNNVYTTCEEGISDPEGYIWRFYNNQTGIEIKEYGKYIENFKIPSNGEWTVYLRVIDKCGNTGEVHNTIDINSQDSNIDLKVSIEASPIHGKGPLLVDFKGIVSGGSIPYIYYWDFGDGNTNYGKETQNIFKEELVYETILYVTDINGDTGKASVLIQVIGINDKEIDSDDDGIPDVEDLCPLVPGVIENQGCPILEEECDQDGECDDGYICDNENICLPEILPISCEYTGGDIIYGNIMCNSCPCNNSLDFISTLRECDIIFPAITSTDGTTIFGKGSLFQIR
ncbi:MAG: PKD domain-containing protein [Candidatus Gracilibacteria bacterium]